MYNTQTIHDLAQVVQISLDNNLKWSGHFLSYTVHQSVENYMDRRAYICGAIWICGLSHFINQITSLRKWMLNNYKALQ